jgi:hypothetical protein
VTLQTFALAAGLQLVAHDASVTTPDAIGDLVEQAAPYTGTGVTLAVREYQNKPGNDGHFVAFDVASANQDVVRFLTMAASGKLPQIGQ